MEISPNFFYGLMLPPHLWPFFCLSGVSVEEFVRFAQDRGEKVVVPQGAKFLCICVVLMGWSWGPWIAQTGVSAPPDAAFHPGTRSSRMMYKVPTQLLGTEAQCLEHNAKLTSGKAEDVQAVAAAGVYKLIDVVYLTDVMYQFLT